MIYLEQIDSAWYYSRTTVDAIPKLYRKIFPLGTWATVYFQAPGWQVKLLGIPLWKWLGLAVLCLLSALLFRLTRLVFDGLVAPRLKKYLELGLKDVKLFLKLSRLLGLWVGAVFFQCVLPML